jgi:hypothetical protein
MSLILTEQGTESDAYRPTLLVVRAIVSRASKSHNRYGVWWNPVDYRAFTIAVRSGFSQGGLFLPKSPIHSISIGYIYRETALPEAVQFPLDRVRRASMA